MNSQENDPYKLGKTAFIHFKGLGDNPNKAGTEAYSQWEKGFKDAYRIKYMDGKTTNDNYEEIAPRLVNDLHLL